AIVISLIPSHKLAKNSLIGSQEAIIIITAPIKAATTAATGNDIAVIAPATTPKTVDNIVKPATNDGIIETTPPKTNNIGPIAAATSPAMAIHCCVESSNSVNQVTKSFNLSTNDLIGPSPISENSIAKPSSADINSRVEPARLSSISSAISPAAPFESTKESLNSPKPSSPSAIRILQADIASAPNNVSSAADFCSVPMPFNPFSNSPAISGMDFISPFASNISIPNSFIKSAASDDGAAKFCRPFLSCLPACPPCIPASPKTPIAAAVSSNEIPISEAIGPTYLNDSPKPSISTLESALALAN